MYVTGTLYDLQARVKQLCFSGADYSGYYSEYTSYTGTAEKNLSNKIARELGLRAYILGL
jgi:hypothetical protein